MRRAERALGRADVVAIVVDAGLDITAQDQHIVGMAIDAGKGVLLVMNKVDLIQDDPEVRDRRLRQLRWRSRFVPWAPVIWSSATEGTNVEEILRRAVAVAAECRKRVGTAEVNAMVYRAAVDHPPATYHGRPIKFFYATQAEIEPPTFVFFANYPDALHFSYERFLQHRIRETFGFEGATLRCVFRQRGQTRG